MVRKAHGVCVSVRGKAQLFGPSLERSHTVLACCLMHGLRKKSKKDNSRIALLATANCHVLQENIHKAKHAKACRCESYHTHILSPFHAASPSLFYQHHFR